MQADERPARDTASHEARLAADLRGDVQGDWSLTWGDVVIIVLGFVLAVGLYVLVLAQP